MFGCMQEKDKILEKEEAKTNLRERESI